MYNGNIRRRTSLLKPVDTAGITKPASDDRLLYDIVMGIYGYQAVLLAHSIGLFSLLSERSRSLKDICEGLRIAARPAETMLLASRALGLLNYQDGMYSLTQVAEQYLVEGSPTYFGTFFDMSIAHRVLTFESLKKAVLTDAPQIYGGDDLYITNEAQSERARAFTRMMHSHSMGPALAWPNAIDLSAHKVMLDIGGGSGAHSIGAALRWPSLSGLLLDLAPVCEVADEYIASFGLNERISTCPSDIWTGPFPKADLHFYSDIYHDFTPEKCRFLTAKSFAALDPGGRIIIHEMLFNDDKAGPFAVAGYNVSMLLWTEGQQFSGTELSTMLREAGFAEIQVTPTFGYWHIVSGVKPGKY
ncbi:MAG: methyltransferase [Nitrospirae bacterium]|nr:methyltransferase [Nitrospirota bacterium]